MQHQSHSQQHKEMTLQSHRHLIVLGLSLGLLFSACKATAPAPATADPVAPAENTPAAMPDATAATCPDADFDAFLTRFSRDIAVQEKETADPLSQSRIDNEAQPEPRPVTKDVPLADVEWPVIPNIEAARNGGREVVISDEADGGRKVLVRTPDTDDQQTYSFVKRPCWTLVRTSDDTL